MLDNAQLLVLKADIAAKILPGQPLEGLDPTNTDQAFAIADYYNMDSSPAFIVWKTFVSTSDCKTATVWTEYIGRSQGERDAWQFMLSNGHIDASDSNIRQGIQDIFSGPSGATTRTNLVAIAKRTANRIEELLATGTGSDASPGTMTHEGQITYEDVLNSNNV